MVPTCPKGELEIPSYLNPVFCFQSKREGLQRRRNCTVIWLLNIRIQYLELSRVKKREGSGNGDLTVDFTSLDEFRVDLEAAGGDITCRCCQWSFLKAGTRTVPFPQPIIGVPGLITPLHCSTIMLAIIKRHSHQTKSILSIK